MADSLSATSATVVVREMGMTHADFYRTFPALVGSATWRSEGDRLQLDDPHGLVVIELRPEQVRRIASLELPITVLHLSFCRHQPEQIATFMERFDLTFRRGGG